MMSCPSVLAWASDSKNPDPYYCVKIDQWLAKKDHNIRQFLNKIQYAFYKNVFGQGLLKHLKWQRLLKKIVYFSHNIFEDTNDTRH